MNSTVTPIFALNLMSCTEPYMDIPTNHTFDEQFTPYNGDFVSPKEEWYYDNRRKSIGFPISKKEYLNMVITYSKIAKIKIDKSQLLSKALEWQQTRGSRSGRVAWQFICDLAGKHGINISHNCL